MEDKLEGQYGKARIKEEKILSQNRRWKRALLFFAGPEGGNEVKEGKIAVFDAPESGLRSVTGLAAQLSASGIAPSVSAQAILAQRINSPYKTESRRVYCVIRAFRTLDLLPATISF
jgi:hypothetical protein